MTAPDAGAVDDGEDGGHRGRSLARSPLAFVVALAVYVALGLVTKSVVLNWIVGPLFPLAALYLLPAALRGRRR